MSDTIENIEGIESAILEKLNDQFWRVNNLYWIQGLTPDGELTKLKFKMNRVQEDYYWNQWWRNDILKSRQHGMSTLIAILMLDQALFNPEQTCGIIDKTDDDAVKKLAKQKYAYDHLDDDDDPYLAPLGAAIKEAIQVVPPSNDHNFTFSNNSKIWAGTNLRGGTMSYLWISELGYTAFFFPKKAAEIKSGSFNTAHRGSKIVIESTHEGGKTGLNYEMIRLAQSAPPRDQMTELDWQFHFYAWHDDPKNHLPMRPDQTLTMTQEETKYFKTLEEEHGISLSMEQKAWYIKIQHTQKDDMRKEHPSTPEEALNAVIKGAIYGEQISRMRREKRIIDFSVDPSYPLWSFWDLGQSDHTSMGLFQFTGRDYSVIDTFTWKGEDYRFYLSKIEEWERKYGFISADFLPHDGNHKQGAMKHSWKDAFEQGGRKNVHIVPRTPDRWIGIRHLRALLPRMWIHATNCDVVREVGYGFDSEEIPSAITCLESYHTMPTESGARIMEMPVHDHTSHTCDMFRTFSEAHARGMLQGNSRMERDSRRNSPKRENRVRVNKSQTMDTSPRRRRRVKTQ